MSIANVSIVGNLVKTPQQVQFSSGKIKTTMVVAVNTPLREKRGGDAADFYRVETWGKLAELSANRLIKGNQVTANGRLLMDKWTDDKGRERVTPTISATEIAFPHRPKSVESNEPAESSEQVEQIEEAASSAKPVAPVSNHADAPLVTNDSESPDAVNESAVPLAADDDSDDDDCDDDDDDDDSCYLGEPNSSTKPVPMRSDRAAPG